MSKRVAKTPGDERLVTRRDLAQKHDVHMLTITKWEQAGMPTAKPGRKGVPSLYDPDEVEAWLQAREEAAKQNGGNLDLTRERALRERAQRIATEQMTAQRAAKLILAEDAMRALVDEVVRVRSALLAWEKTLPHRVARAYELEGERGVAREIRSAAEEVLAQLAKTDDLDQAGKPKPKKKRATKKAVAKKRKRAKKVRSR